MDALVLIVSMILHELIPAAAIGATIVVILRTKAGRGLLQRLASPDPDSSDIAMLKEQVARLQEDLVETQERLDFTERIRLGSNPSTTSPRELTPEETTPV